MNGRFRAPFCALVLSVMACGAVSVAAASPAAAAESHAVVVVDTGSDIYIVPISFSGATKGIDALNLAGANPALYGFSGPGVAVCRLYG